jgi:hypothetical protein
VNQGIKICTTVVPSICCLQVSLKKEAGPENSSHNINSPVLWCIVQRIILNIFCAEAEPSRPQSLPVGCGFLHCHRSLLHPPVPGTVLIYPPVPDTVLLHPPVPCIVLFSFILQYQILSSFILQCQELSSFIFQYQCNLPVLDTARPHSQVAGTVLLHSPGQCSVQLHPSVPGSVIHPLVPDSSSSFTTRYCLPSSSGTR